MKYEPELYIEHKITHEILARVPKSRRLGSWFDLALDRYWLLQVMSKHHSLQLDLGSNTHEPMAIVRYIGLKKQFSVGDTPKKWGMLNRAEVLMPVTNELVDREFYELDNSI